MATDQYREGERGGVTGGVEGGGGKEGSWTGLGDRYRGRTIIRKEESSESCDVMFCMEYRKYNCERIK